MVKEAKKPTAAERAAYEAKLNAVAGKVHAAEVLADQAGQLLLAAVMEAQAVGLDTATLARMAGGLAAVVNGLRQHQGR